AAVVEATDLAVATSGAYARGDHVLDPHTAGPPAGVLSVTVAGPDLATADAYATAAFAMGTAGPAWTATLRNYETLTILEGARVPGSRAPVRAQREPDRQPEPERRGRDHRHGGRRHGSVPVRGLGRAGGPGLGLRLRQGRPHRHERARDRRRLLDHRALRGRH